MTVEIDFHQCQQNPGELVVDYAQRFKVLAKRLYDDYIQAEPVQMTILRKFLGELNWIFRDGYAVETQEISKKHSR